MLDAIQIPLEGLTKVLNDSALNEHARALRKNSNLVDAFSTATLRDLNRNGSIGTMFATAVDPDFSFPMEPEDNEQLASQGDWQAVFFSRGFSIEEFEAILLNFGQPNEAIRQSGLSISPEGRWFGFPGTLLLPFLIGRPMPIQLKDYKHIFIKNEGEDDFRIRLVAQLLPLGEIESDILDCVIRVNISEEIKPSSCCGFFGGGKYMMPEIEAESCSIRPCNAERYAMYEGLVPEDSNPAVSQYGAIN